MATLTILLSLLAAAVPASGPVRGSAAAPATGSAATSAHASGPQEPSVPIGLFIASIEEGARIFTPVRLLPFEHPDAFGHEFPNALVLHRSELDLLVDLGHRVGLGLATTLERYPRPPVDEWPYPELEPPPAIGPSAREVAADGPPPLPGLRAACFRDGRLIAFIVDTRGMTLGERGMSRPTSMGLDLTRAEFLEALGRVADRWAPAGEVVVTFARSAGGP